MTGKQKNWLAFAIKLAIGLAIIAWLLRSYRGKFGLLREASIAILPLAGTVLVIGLMVIMTFVRWYIMVRAQGLTFRFSDAFALGYIGYFFSTFIPGAVGGDLVKAAYVAREQSQRAVAVATVVLDRILGLYGMFVMGTITTLVFLDRVLANPALRPAAVAVWAAAGIGTVGLVIGFAAIFYKWRWVEWTTRLRWIGGPLRSIFRSMEVYRKRVGVLFVCVGMSVVGHLLIVFGMYFVGLALRGLDTPALGDLCFVCPVGMFLNALPISPGGLGVGEAAFGELFNAVLTGDADAARMTGSLSMLLYRMAVWVTTIPGFICYLRGRQALKQLQSQAEELAHLGDGNGTGLGGPISDDG